MPQIINRDVIKNQTGLISLPASALVITAAKLMHEHNIGAIMVGTNGDYKGIFTERDLLRRVVAAGLDPSNTTLDQVMTRSIICIPVGDNLHHALELMQTKGIRHLPLVENHKIVAIVSIRDLFAAAMAELQENIKRKDALIFGESYGMS